MAATAIILLLISRIWLFFEPSRFPIALSLFAGGKGVLLGVCISLVSALVYRVWPAYRKSADFYLAFVLAPLTPTDSIWIGLLPGMSEELLFRGLLQPAIAYWTGPLIGLLAASVLFGLAHLITPTYAIMAGLMGCVIGWAMQVTDNLLSAMVIHAVYDFIALSYFLRVVHRDWQPPSE